MAESSQPVPLFEAPQKNLELTTVDAEKTLYADTEDTTALAKPESHDDEDREPSDANWRPEVIATEKPVPTDVTALRGQVEAICDDSVVVLPAEFRIQLDRLKITGRQIEKDKQENDDEKYVCGVLRLPMNEWLKKDWNEQGPPLHVIKAYYRSVPNRSQIGVERSSEKSDSSSGSEKPLRVIITSEFLIQNLEEITGIGIEDDPLVVNYPYKLFMHVRPYIESYLVKLKAKEAEFNKVTATDKINISTGQNKTLDSPADPSKDTDQPSSERERAAFTNPNSEKPDAHSLRKRIEHLELPENFIKTDLGHLVRIRRQIAGCALGSIAFEDLWHLFKPGDILFTTRNGHEQLFVVYMVTGGKQRLRNRTKAEIQDIRLSQRHHRFSARASARDGSDSVSSDEEDEDERPRMDPAGKGTWAPLVIDCYRIAYDRSYVGPVDSSKKITRFVGKKRITDLPVYPLQFHPKSDEVMEYLEQRGRRFIQCNGHRSYDGPVFDRRGKRTKGELQGDVYVDFKEYYRSKSKFTRPKLGKLRMSQPDGTEITEQDHRSSRVGGQLIELMDHVIDQLRTDTFLAEKTSTRELMTTSEALDSPGILRLFPHWVVAFAFRNRSWVHLDLDHVTEIDKSDDSRKTGFNELVIPPKYRRLLVSLVETHTSDTRVKPNACKPDATEEPVRQIDLIRGKGLGLIILLHGPPGSGKTSTAETIAAYTGRPLYTLTCGDLGLTPKDVEKALESHTRRADKWGCVLLLDEADVFLMKREWKDMARNALVAVFLRQLEYYAGILFLTTNRVGVLDEAFKSRIHIALRYPKIEQRQTTQIWQNILDHLERDNENREIKIEFDREELLYYAETQFEKYKATESTWNGRQIRNAFQTAIALGQYERSIRLLKKGLTSEEAISTGKRKWMRLKLTTESFDIIADTAQEFENYLCSVQGDTDPNLAFEDQWRNDNFDARTSATTGRKDNSNINTTSFARGTLSSGATQRPKPSAKPADAGIGGSGLQRTKMTWHSTSKMSQEDSEDSSVEDDRKKKRSLRKKTESSDSESD
ncbi:hypothetical protein F4779DRAFT_622600 [Xylariaceae sp. FL0662B]|nr:hypothetical protein F4779DRAFT_622600 [Xylariaceae sp. FL0662B]